VNGQVLQYVLAGNQWENQMQLLAALGDVLISSPSDGQVLTYVAAASQWQNKAAAGGGTVGKGIKYYLGANQSIAGDGNTYIVDINTKVYDDYSEFNASTYQFTPSTTGKYLIGLGFCYLSLTTACDGIIFDMYFNEVSPFTTILQKRVLPRLIATNNILDAVVGTANLTSGKAYAFYVMQYSGSAFSLSKGEAQTWLMVVRLF
jgi:hypothetical protein